MKNISKLAIAAALAVSTATPAMAAWNGGKGLDEKIAQLDQRVKDAQGSSTITEAQATQLSQAVAALQSLHTRFSKGGINPEEQSMLENRIAKVKQQIDSAAGKS